MYVIFKKLKTCPVLLLSYRNTSGSLGEQEMLWEHDLQASVSTAFLSSPKLSQVFLELDRNTENMFSISSRKHRDEKGKQLVYFDHQDINSLCMCHHYINVQLVCFYLNNRVFLSRDYWLIVAPRKFDVLKSNICPRSKASKANMLVLRTSNFQGATIRSIVP